MGTGNLPFKHGKQALFHTPYDKLVYWIDSEHILADR